MTLRLRLHVMLTFNVLEMKKVYAIIVELGSDTIEAELETHLKSYAGWREIMNGFWVLMTSKSSVELYNSIQKHISIYHPPPEIAILRIDGEGLDWFLSEGVKEENRDWLFENLNHSSHYRTKL